MKPTLTLYLKPKAKIGSLIWGLKPGVCRADYFKNPSDDLFESRKVTSYSITYKNGKAKINAYNYGERSSDTLEHGWMFPSKKELKEFLKQEMIKNYNSKDPSWKRVRLDKLNLTREERIRFKIE